MPRWRGRICSWRALTSGSRYGGTRATVLESLGECPAFDLIFIDADKPNNPHYLRWALRYSAQEP